MRINIASFKRSMAIWRSVALTRNQENEENLQQVLHSLQLCQAENRALQAQLRDHENSYVRNEVRSYPIKSDNEIAMKQKVHAKHLSLQADVNKHTYRLQEWNNCNAALQSTFEHGMNDQKEEHKESESLRLFDLYANCMKQLHTQHTRSVDISECVIALSKCRKSIKTAIKEYDKLLRKKPDDDEGKLDNEHADQTSIQQQYDALQAQHNQLRLQREALQQDVQQMADRMNSMIDSENAINQQRCNVLNQLNVLKLEKQKFDALYAKCKALPLEYKQFETNVAAKTQTLQTHFAQKWNEHERSWKTWNVDDMLSWIKYLVHDEKVKFSQPVRLDTVGNEMRSKQFNGAMLPNIEQMNFRFFESFVVSDYQQIHQAIKQLIEKYPHVPHRDDNASDEEVEGQVMVTKQAPNIPQEYLCPISNTIMQDPVIYDGITYDRSNLMQYVQRHGTVPDSQEEYDDDEQLFENKKLKQKIEKFLLLHPQ